MILDEIIRRTQKRVALLPTEFPEIRYGSHASLIDAIWNRNGRNAVIAETLGISPKTVARHRENIMHKLGLHSRTELVKYAIRKGIIQP